MAISKANIGQALHSVADDHVTAVANDIYDETLEKYQSEINAEVGQGDGVYDISAANPTDGNPTPYASLQDALTAFTDTTKKKGGMTIKYIGTDGKYHQYRYLLSTTTGFSDIANWEESGQVGIGYNIISKWSSIAAGRYFNVAVGSTVDYHYPSTSNNGHVVYRAACKKGDTVVFGTKQGYNIPVYLVCNSNMKVLSQATKKNVNTPVAVNDLTITDDEAAYIVINSLGETENYIYSEDSIYGMIQGISSEIESNVSSSVNSINAKADSLQEQVGNTVINRWSSIATGKYFNVAVGATIDYRYPSTDSKYYVYRSECSKDDIVIFGTKQGYNHCPYFICDSSMKVLSRGEPINTSTPVAVAKLTITDDDAAYIVINSIGETTNYINHKDSVNAKVLAANDKLLVNRRKVTPIVFKDVSINSYGNISWYSTKNVFLVWLKDLNVTKIRCNVDGTLSAHLYSGFMLNDGTFSSVWDSAGKTKTIQEFDVPSNAVMFKGTFDQSVNVQVQLTYETLSNAALNSQQNLFIDTSVNRFMSIVEANKTGRFAFETVGVQDYYNAFHELSYSFPGFVKMTNIGTSQTPLPSKSDQNTYPIERYRFQKIGANPTKTIVLSSGMHGDSEDRIINAQGNSVSQYGWANNGGDSPQNILSLYYFLYDLLSNCDNDLLYKELTDNYIIEVIPILNPWGIQNHSRHNGRGVDLNRNYDCNWDTYQVTDVLHDNKGESVFSEAESQAYRDYINGLIQSDNLVDVIEVHSRGEITMLADSRFFGVCNENRYGRYNAVAYAMKNKHKSTQAGWTSYNSSTSYPSAWCWINFTLGIEACDVECCQSLANDITTRNGKLVNVQMADYVKWFVLMTLGIV